MPSTLAALYITICSVLFIISKMLISFLLYKKWARKKRIIENSLTGGKMVIFRSATMQSLTPKSFLGMIMGLSNKDIIGAGGYGTVYKLRVDDKTAFAVKKLNRGSAEMDRGFERELDTMGDIKHRNIVPLCGYYAAPHFNLLIYELMPNGSLDSILHGRKEKEEYLDWPARYKIALGVARGLSYLHHDCIPHVIHRDIKSSNILLDHNMEARVSDFGLATLMKPNESHVTTVVAGTFGYLAPEYFDTGRATTKGDVYSYGVVLLELLTGKRPTDESFLENGTRLVTWVKETMEEKREEHAVDEALPCFPTEEVKFVFTVADKCLDSDPCNRPTMAQVVKMLEQGKQS
ncbi:receptor-like serine/threonine-protein kinase At1g78530 [Phragmites australis]|uniref:receptor-like serine/threonine-protein kinase At1g78530 n=1 Tax=Phragmites australis TaxID=29695 RepID=UPI002D797587|nr:receptor-like serine/threonine-protein kinase At1g78530 [Phragmites australis]